MTVLVVSRRIISRAEVAQGFVVAWSSAHVGVAGHVIVELVHQDVGVEKGVVGQVRIAANSPNQLGYPVVRGKVDSVGKTTKPFTDVNPVYTAPEGLAETADQVAPYLIVGFSLLVRLTIINGG